jgi:membrane associated rhomboid family serine protease
VKSIRSEPFLQIGVLIAVMFIVHAVNAASGGWPIQYGIIPRTILGLRGIAFSPLLHGDLNHLLANVPPLAVMLGLLSLNKPRSFWAITAGIWLASGALVWLVGRPNSVQIGASGLIYGLAAYLVTAAWTTRDLRSALVAIIVVFFYGSIVWGLLPTKPGVSWEGHLSGAIAGFLVARMGGRKTSPR